MWHGRLSTAIMWGKAFLSNTHLRWSSMIVKGNYNLLAQLFSVLFKICSNESIKYEWKEVKLRCHACWEWPHERKPYETLNSKKFKSMLFLIFFLTTLDWPLSRGACVCGLNPHDGVVHHRHVNIKGGSTKSAPTKHSSSRREETSQAVSWNKIR